MIVDPTTKPIQFVTALNTVDKLHPTDIESSHATLTEAMEYAHKRKRAVRVYACTCVGIVTAESRRNQVTQ